MVCWFHSSCITYFYSLSSYSHLYHFLYLNSCSYFYSCSLTESKNAPSFISALSLTSTTAPSPTSNPVHPISSTSSPPHTSTPVFCSLLFLVCLIPLILSFPKSYFHYCSFSYLKSCSLYFFTPDPFPESYPISISAISLREGSRN